MPRGELLRKRGTTSRRALRRDLGKRSGASFEPRRFSSADGRQRGRTGPIGAKPAAGFSGNSATPGTAAGAEAPLHFPESHRQAYARGQHTTLTAYSPRPPLHPPTHPPPLYYTP